MHRTGEHPHNPQNVDMRARTSLRSRIASCTSTRTTCIHNCTTRSSAYACLNFSRNIGLIFTDFVATCQFSPRTAKCCALLCDRSVCCTCDAGAHRGLHTAHCSHSLTGDTTVPRPLESIPSPNLNATVLSYRSPSTTPGVQLYDSSTFTLRWLAVQSANGCLSCRGHDHRSCNNETNNTLANL
jgi:hypothetical protein